MTKNDSKKNADEEDDEEPKVPGFDTYVPQSYKVKERPVAPIKVVELDSQRSESVRPRGSLSTSDRFRRSMGKQMTILINAKMGTSAIGFNNTQNWSKMSPRTPADVPLSGMKKGGLNSRG